MERPQEKFQNRCRGRRWTVGFVRSEQIPRLSFTRLRRKLSAAPPANGPISVFKSPPQKAWLLILYKDRSSSNSSQGSVAIFKRYFVDGTIALTRSSF
jgi:hypothetical protein